MPLEEKKIEEHFEQEEIKPCFSSPKKKQDLIYRWLSHLSTHRHASLALFIVSFLESSIFAIPPDTLLIPMVLHTPKKLHQYVLLSTLASVLGGIVAYMLAAYLFQLIAVPILNFYHLLDKFSIFKNWYHQHGAVVIFLAGITPFPFKLITLASGAVHSPFIPFVLTCFLARSLRFYIVSFLTRLLRYRILAILERWTTPITIIVTIFVIIFLLYTIL